MLQLNEINEPDETYVAGDSTLKTNDPIRTASSQLLLIDHRSAAQCHLRDVQLQRLADNVKALSGTARSLNVPTTIVTRIVNDDTTGHGQTSVTQFPGGHLIEQSAVNVWEEVAVQKVLAENARRYLVVSELWADDSDFCFTRSAIKAANYKAYLITNASGSFSPDKDRKAFEFLKNAGVELLSLEEIINAWQRTAQETRKVDAGRSVEQFPSLD